MGAAVVSEAVVGPTVAMIVVGGGVVGEAVVSGAVVGARVVMIVVGGGVVGAAVVAESEAGAAVVGEAAVSCKKESNREVRDQI